MAFGIHSGLLLNALLRLRILPSPVLVVSSSRAAELPATVAIASLHAGIRSVPLSSEPLQREGRRFHSVRGTRNVSRNRAILS